MDALWTIIIAALASINCALVGTYLVLRKIAMMGDAIAHSTLPGIVLALLITGSKNSPALIAGAGITGLLVTFLIAFLEKKNKHTGRCGYRDQFYLSLRFRGHFNLFF